MKLLHFCRVACVVVPIGLVTGCNSSEQAPLKQRPTTINVNELPELGDAIGPLDGQRIEVAPPRGWQVPPRSSQWIVRFAASEQTSYPSIIIRAENYEGAFNVSRANVDEFARQIAGSLEKDKSAAKRTVTVTPIEIGRFVGVSCRRRGKVSSRFKSIVVERLLLDTVVAGRKYTIELQTREGDLDIYRDHLFAVAAGIKFLQPESEGESPQPDADSEFELTEEDEV